MPSTQGHRHVTSVLGTSSVNNTMVHNKCQITPYLNTINRIQQLWQIKCNLSPRHYHSLSILKYPYNFRQFNQNRFTFTSFSSVKEWEKQDCTWYHWGMYYYILHLLHGQWGSVWFINIVCPTPPSCICLSLSMRGMSEQSVQVTHFTAELSRVFPEE